MGSEWEELTLEDSMDAVIDYRGKTPRKTSSGIPLITAKIVKGGRIETPNEFIAEEDYVDWMRRGVPECGDVVVTTEAPLGEVAQLGNERVALAQRLICLRGKPGVLNNNFLKFLMQSNGVQEQLRSRATGTTVLGIKQSELRKVILPLPPLPEQRAIAHILGTLDDKIELNRRMNETLEELARALFKSWFVDFDPVHAKATLRNHALHDGTSANQGGSDWSVGRAHAYLDSMDPAIAALFPDHFVDSELGEIPTGWKVGVLGDVLRQRVERCRASEETALLPYVPIDCISPRSLSLTESKAGVEAKSSLTKFYAGDLLFGAMRPYYHKVCIAPFDGTTRTTAFVLHPKRENDFSFAALLLHDAATIDFATRNSTGSTIPYAVWSGSLEEMTITLPASSVLNVFDKIVRPLFMRVIQPYFESRALAALRDALLPKLVSGELQANRLMASGMAL